MNVCFRDFLARLCAERELVDARGGRCARQPFAAKPPAKAR